MNRLILLFGIFFLLSCNSRNHSGSVTENELEQNKTNTLTKFEFKEEMHNFGTLQSGERLIYSFQFTNTGKENLRINSVETDCGCVKIKFPEEPVLPGKNDYIEVEFDSSGLFGRQLKTIEIHANVKKPKQLAIFADVVNEQIEIKY